MSRRADLFAYVAPQKTHRLGLGVDHANAVGKHVVAENDDAKRDTGFQAGVVGVEGAVVVDLEEQEPDKESMSSYQACTRLL